ncbi:MAG: NAD(P)-dependent oxidoreductase [Bacillota bacterium]
MEKIGFIGLGNMGKPMATNLVKAGYQVTVYDIYQPSVEELVESGAASGNTPKKVSENSDVVITMLPSSPHVEQVVLGQDGVLEGIRQGCLFIDMSSIAPDVSIKVAKRCRDKGVGVLDAPVTGGIMGAQAGTLGIMVGGSKADLARATPILNVMGKKIMHVGDVGMGQTAKVCNQIMVGTSLCAMSEALVLGVKAGADPEVLQQILISGAARSWALEFRAPAVFEGNFNPGFMINLQHKDLGLALDTGKEFHVPLALTALAYQQYEAARAKGLGEADHAGVIKVLEDLVGVEVRKGVNKIS